MRYGICKYVLYTYTVQLHLVRSHPNFSKKNLRCINMEPSGLHVRKMIGSERIFEEDAFLGSLQLLHLAVASMFIVAAGSRQILLLHCAVITYHYQSQQRQ